MWKFLSFIDTEDSGITESSILYLSKYPGPFANVDIRPVAFPLVLFKFFGYVNDVESYNKSRQSDLALEKYCVTQFGWLILCKAVTMGMNITNFWKLFCFGVNRYHYEKLIGIREFSEWLDLDWFDNPFSTDTGTPKKKLLLDEVDALDIFFTFCSLHFLSYSSYSTEIRNIYDLTINTAS